MEVLIVISIFFTLVIGVTIGATLAFIFGPEVVTEDINKLYELKKDLELQEHQLRQEQQLIANMRLSAGFQKKQKKLKKIYVVTSGIYDGYSVNKISVSKKLANRFCDNQNTEYNCDDYRVEEFNISQK